MAGARMRSAGYRTYLETTAQSHDVTHNTLQCRWKIERVWIVPDAVRPIAVNRHQPHTTSRQW